MPRTFRWIALGLLLAAPILLAETAPPAAKPHHKAHKAVKPLVLPPLPPGPLRQVPMDQLPATPARVSYQNGLLAISAQNSTLGEILRDVRNLTGTTIDIPPGPGANERVIMHLGPGAPWDVLTRLLNGSSFNYIMLGSSSDPTAIASVVLTAKTSAVAGTQTAANDYKTVAPAGPTNRPNFPINPSPVPMVQPAAAEPDEDAKDDEENADDNANSDDQTQPEQPGVNPANPAQPQVDPNQPNAGPRTPEQILEMMRRQQPGNPQPPPQPPQQ